MADPLNGKSFFICFSLLFSFTLLFISPLYATESPVIEDVSTDVAVSVSETNREAVLLHNLEELVKNLTELVANLDAKLSATPLKEKNEISVDDDIGEEKERGRAKAFSVTKYSPFWSERFQFTSAVKLNSDATCINVLPFRDFEGSSKYFAIGDSKGRVYVFLRNGDVLIEFFTTVDSPVTAMVSYSSVFKNSSFVVTGHQNGAVLLHRIHEGSNGEDWNSNSVSMEHVGKFDVDDSADPVTLLEVHHVGRVRYILATDLSGKLTVLTENRTVYGSVIPSSRPLVFLKQRLLFLTESGAGSLDLRSMKIRETECEGLNHSLARTYVFDEAERSKAYGFTSEGEIIHVLLHGDIMNFKCRVRSKKKFQMEEPVALQSIKGYLLVINEEKVFAFNVSTQHYVRTAGPRLLFSAGLEEIRSAFLSHRESSSRTTTVVKTRPLIASDRENLLVIGLENGYFAVYKSKLPTLKGDFNTMLWSSPVFFFILFLFGAWHFFAKKKESLTAWGPDDPFTPTGAQNSSAKEPTFTEPSRRNDDLMDLRRRYAGGSYRSVGANDPSSRAPVDGNYRTTAQDHNNYRGGGSGLDSNGFGNRRDHLFGNNKVLDNES
ncbi:WD40-repeat-containing domain superfamily [Arabidopsis suecica]|uniref:WD40-repeat-containing domain superfamily n=1 Tax=Arabidopsis suecica TaxID=45249 RepID=A0A8T2H7U5_ARASU|nr:WD40-repeat-containing domain superfamily [Arabidopsis suecica]